MKFSNAIEVDDGKHKGKMNIPREELKHRNDKELQPNGIPGLNYAKNSGGSNSSDEEDRRFRFKELQRTSKDVKIRNANRIGSLYALNAHKHM